MRNTGDWYTFAQTGRVEDYLKYKSGCDAACKEAGAMAGLEKETETEKIHAEFSDGLRNHNQVRGQFGL